LLKLNCNKTLSKKCNRRKAFLLINNHILELDFFFLEQTNLSSVIIISYEQCAQMNTKQEGQDQNTKEAKKPNKPPKNYKLTNQHIQNSSHNKLLSSKKDRHTKHQKQDITETKQCAKTPSHNRLIDSKTQPQLSPPKTQTTSQPFHSTPPGTKERYPHTSPFGVVVVLC